MLRVMYVQEDIFERLNKIKKENETFSQLFKRLLDSIMPTDLNASKEMLEEEHSVVAYK